MCDEDILTGIFIGLIITLIVTVGALILFGVLGTDISKQGMNEICQRLSNTNINYNAYVDVTHHLVCEAPSYDNTQAIIFKTNAGGQR